MGARFWLVIVGIAGVIAGLLAFAWPGVTALVLLFFIAVWAIVARIPSRTNVRASTVMPALVAGIHALLDGSPAHINIDGTSTRLSGKLRFS
jgi:hypothetical protein